MGFEFLGGSPLDGGASDVAGTLGNTTDTGAFLGNVKDWLNLGLTTYLTVDGVKKGHMAIGSDGVPYDPMLSNDEKKAKANSPAGLPMGAILLGGAALVVVMLLVAD